MAKVPYSHSDLVRFYAVLPYTRGSKGSGKHGPRFDRAYLERLVSEGKTHNCIAVLVGAGKNGAGMYDVMAPISDRPNAGLEFSTAQPEWINSHSVPVTLAEMQVLHPRLFERFKETP